MTLIMTRWRSKVRELDLCIATASLNFLAGLELKHLLKNLKMEKVIAKSGLVGTWSHKYLFTLCQSLFWWLTLFQSSFWEKFLFLRRDSQSQSNPILVPNIWCSYHSSILVSLSCLLISTLEYHLIGYPYPSYKGVIMSLQSNGTD